MAEVHIMGQIESASNFPDHKLFCCWELHYGKIILLYCTLCCLCLYRYCTLGGGWRLLGGISEGQTQTDQPVIEQTAYFAHPIDMHLSTRTIQGM